MSAGNSGSGQDFELNLAPIIDCFTVLIAFMLATAAFLQIGILDAGVALGAVETQSKETPDVYVEVELRENSVIRLKTTGKKTVNEDIAAGTLGRDMDGLMAKLQAIKAQHASLTGVTLSAEGNVEYKDLVQTMERMRKDAFAIQLGGF
jgi:biopolymer transport protein ExbD